MLINLWGDNHQPPNAISLDHCLNHPTGEEEKEEEGEGEAYENGVMKPNLIPYLFISLPASPFYSSTRANSNEEASNDFI